MSLFMRDSLGRLVPVNPGLPVSRGNQGGMGRILSEAELMARLPDADIAGAIGPGVMPGGEQSIGARRVKLEAADALSPPAPTFRPLGGAQQNNRGNARSVTIPTFSGGPSQRIPSVVETAKSSGDDAEAISVQLSMELPEQMQDPASPYANTLIDVVAILEWGVGGAFFSAELDWNQGVAFTVCASFVRVSARIQNFIAQGIPDIDIVLRASLAYGNANSINVSSPARRSVLLGTPVAGPGDFTSGTTLAAGADSAIIPIPLWALGFTVVDGGQAALLPPSPDYQIRLFTSLGLGAEVTYELKSRSNLGNQVEGQFPVPGRCRFLRVTNMLGVEVFCPRVIFNHGF
jgi:hypothetical protein